MELDDEVAAALAFSAAHPGPSILRSPLVEAREAYDSGGVVLDPSPPDIESSIDLEVEGAVGPLRARRYEPVGGAGGRLLVWLHGGGWVQGSLVSHDQAMRRLCAESGVAVLAVEYRLAPEHRFPAGLDDAEAAVRWTLRHADELDAAAGQIALGGDSAGATLALAAALGLARTGESLCQLVLCYPSLGPEIRSESHHDFAEGYGLTAAEMDALYALYLPEGQDHADPRVSPLLTPDLHETPPTVLAVAGYDVLRDEGLALGGLLESSGVPVELLDASSMPHGFLRLGGVAAGARAAVRQLGGLIAAGFGASS